MKRGTLNQLKLGILGIGESIVIEIDKSGFKLMKQTLLMIP